MSIEALAYAKLLDLGTAESAQARLLVYVIAENTFNDTFICRLGQAQLAYEAGRVHERTIRRHLDTLEAAKIIVRPRRRSRDSDGQLKEVPVRIRGFKRWYIRDHKAAPKRSSLPAKMSGGGGSSSGQIVRKPADTCCPVASGQQVSGTYKDTRTSIPVPSSAQERASDFNLDLEGKGVRDRLRQTMGGPKFAAWCADMAFVLVGDVVNALSPDRLKARWCQQHFAEKILAACQAEWPGVRTVSIQVCDQGGQQ